MDDFSISLSYEKFLEMEANKFLQRLVHNTVPLGKWEYDGISDTIVTFHDAFKNDEGKWVVNLGVTLLSNLERDEEDD